MEDEELIAGCLALLRRELVPAMGCTEPIAVAYAAALAADMLEEKPEHIETYCSPSVVKNVHSVDIPHAGGLRGVEAAAALGALAGDSRRELEVLCGVSGEDVSRAGRMVREHRSVCRLAQEQSDLYIRAVLRAGTHTAEVEIAGKHTHVTRKVLDGKQLFSAPVEKAAAPGGFVRSLTLDDILRFAERCPEAELERVLERQARDNLAIAQEGLERPYGIGVGRFLADRYGMQDVRVRARAYAAAGSDARMGGCPMPVVINSGSGNQGMTVSLPVIVYARQMRAPQAAMYRALAVANLVALLQKSHIGSLSAFCGAVCAATGAGCGIVCLKGGGREEMSSVITYTLGTVGGMVCDGAKASCAAKIDTALETALLAADRAMAGRPVFSSGEGLVRDTAEETIGCVGRMGREGMRDTNMEIVRMMLERDA